MNEELVSFTESKWSLHGSSDRRIGVTITKAKSFNRLHQTTLFVSRLVFCLFLFYDQNVARIIHENEDVSVT
jgi:hypothetical protein